MKNAKRTVWILLAILLLVVSLTACGKKKPEPAPATTPAPVVTTTQPAPVVTTTPAPTPTTTTTAPVPPTTTTVPVPPTTTTTVIPPSSSSSSGSSTSSSSSGGGVEPPKPVKHEITWIVDGVSFIELYEEGQLPTFAGDTFKPADNEYTYEFAGWTPEVVPVSGPATYTAKYISIPVGQPVQHAITWDVNGNLIEEFYNEGETPYFKGDVPSYSDEEYVYTFAGWEPAITPVSGPATYKAVYDKTPLEQPPVEESEGIVIYCESYPDEGLTAMVVGLYGDYAVAGLSLEFTFTGEIVEMDAAQGVTYSYTTDAEGNTTVRLTLVSTKNVGDVNLFCAIVGTPDDHVISGEVTECRAWQDGVAVPVEIPVYVLCADELY